MKLTRTANQAARVLAKIYELETGNELSFLVISKYAAVVQVALNGSDDELDSFLTALNKEEK